MPVRKIKQVLDATKTTVTPQGDKFHAVSDDKHLDVMMSIPEALGGVGGPGPNPQQMFGAAYAKCFHGILPMAATEFGDYDMTDTVVTCDVALGLAGENKFAISADLTAHHDDYDVDIVQKIVDRAKTICPYSLALKGNIEVTYTAV